MCAAVGCCAKEKRNRYTFSSQFNQLFNIIQFKLYLETRQTIRVVDLGTISFCEMHK